MKKVHLIPFLVIAGLIACSSEDSPTGADNSSGNTESVKSCSSSTDKENTSTASSSSTKENNEVDSVKSSSSTNENSDSSNIKEDSNKGFPDNYDSEKETITDERDGEVYATTKIANQIWMAENLRYHPSSGSEFCVNVDEPEDEEKKKIYGNRYTWRTATAVPCEVTSQEISNNYIQKPHHQGICPKGWHIPTFDEWQELFNTTPIQHLLSTEWTIGYQGTNQSGFNIRKRQSDEGLAQYVTLELAGEYTATIAFDLGEISSKSKTISYDILYIRCLMD